MQPGPGSSAANPRDTPPSPSEAARRAQQVLTASSQAKQQRRWPSARLSLTRRNPAARYPRGPQSLPLRPSQVRGGLRRSRKIGSSGPDATTSSSPSWAGGASVSVAPRAPRQGLALFCRGRARPVGPGASPRRPGSAPAGSATSRAGVRAARAPAAPQLPAREPISAGQSGGYFLVGPVARSRQLGRLRGGAGTAPSLSACVHWCDGQGWAQVLEGAPLQIKQKETWGAGWWGVRLTFRAWSVGSAAPGSEMSKPPPKPVKPGKGGARRVP